MKSLLSIAVAVSVLVQGCTTSTCHGAVPATPKRHYKLGYIPDRGGVTYRNLKGTRHMLTPIMSHTDLSADMHSVYDQGQQGSCVGHGFSVAVSAAYHRQTGVMLDMSRSFPYYIARDLEGNPLVDTGCQLADCATQMIKLGDCRGVTWAYCDSDWGTTPSQAAYSEAVTYGITAYKVDSSDGTSIRRALSAGFPVVFGSNLYSAFEDLNAVNDIVPMPQVASVPMGGHCEVIFGSDDATQLYAVQNSWGTTWGNQGRCRFPYAYIHDPSLTDDCWVVETIAIPAPQASKHTLIWRLFHAF